MLKTYFFVRGTLYKSSKIPSSFDELRTGAAKILKLLQGNNPDTEKSPTQLYFTYTTATQNAEKAITGDEGLMLALT